MSRVLLLAALLAACAALCRGAPVTGELRCQCLQTVSERLGPRRLAHVELIAEGPHCPVPEVIATLKDGRKLCLSPAAPWVQPIISKILQRKTDEENV